MTWDQNPRFSNYPTYEFSLLRHSKDGQQCFPHSLIRAVWWYLGSYFNMNVSVNHMLLQNQTAMYTTKFLTIQDDGFKLTFRVLISGLGK